MITYFEIQNLDALNDLEQLLVDVAFYQQATEEDKEKADDSLVRDLENHVWTLAENYVPGYEINDGGGYRLIFSRSQTVEGQIDLYARGYYNVISEQEECSFNYGSDAE